MTRIVSIKEYQLEKIRAITNSYLREKAGILRGWTPLPNLKERLDTSSCWKILEEEKIPYISCDGNYFSYFHLWNVDIDKINNDLKSIQKPNHILIITGQTSSLQVKIKY